MMKRKLWRSEITSAVIIHLKPRSLSIFKCVWNRNNMSLHVAYGIHPLPPRFQKNHYFRYCPKKVSIEIKYPKYKILAVTNVYTSWGIWTSFRVEKWLLWLSQCYNVKLNFISFKGEKNKKRRWDMPLFFFLVIRTCHYWLWLIRNFPLYIIDEGEVVTELDLICFTVSWGRIPLCKLSFEGNIFFWI